MADFDILIQGGTVVNSDREFKSDVGIVGGKIEKVGKNLKPGKNTKVVDAKGKLVMPGGIDPHTHMELPFMGTISSDDFETGSRAALAGGTTMFIDFCVPKKGGSLVDCYKSYRKKADAKCCSDYGLHMCIPSWNDNLKTDMEELVKNCGVTSFKFFLAYKGALMVNDNEIINILKMSKQLGAVAECHCENGDLVEQGQKKLLQMGITDPCGHIMSRPPEVEAEATARACRIAKFVDCPLYIVHVMSKNAMEEIGRAKLRGQRVIGETLACAIELDESLCFQKDWNEAVKYIMSPPIRPKSHIKPMKYALKNRVLDLIGSDHCTFKMEQRKMGKGNFTKIPNGLNGIEDRMNICYTNLVQTGLISNSDYVRLTSTECAQIYNIYPRKGVIMEGSDADVIVFDPKKEKIISAKTHHQNLDYNVFEGKKCKGCVVVTVSKGRVVFENGKLNVKKGSGEFVPTKSFGKLFTGLEKEIETNSEHKIIANFREKL